MRIFPIPVAAVSLVAGFVCVLIVPKCRAMYEGVNAVLPKLTVAFLNTSGWLPGGLFLLAAMLLFFLVALKRSKTAGGVAVFTLICLIGTAVVLPMVLYAPLSMARREAEAARNLQEAEHDGLPQTSPSPAVER